MVQSISSVLKFHIRLSYSLSLYVLYRSFFFDPVLFRTFLDGYLFVKFSIFLEFFGCIFIVFFSYLLVINDCNFGSSGCSCVSFAIWFFSMCVIAGPSCLPVCGFRSSPIRKKNASMYCFIPINCFSKRVTSALLGRSSYV